MAPSKEQKHIKYDLDDQRIWQVHLSADSSVDRVELEICYPYQVLGAQTEREKGFRFNIDLSVKGAMEEPLIIKSIKHFYWMILVTNTIFQ